MLLKDKLQYFSEPNAGFTPLPKYGQYSALDADFAAVKEGVDQVMRSAWDQPSVETLQQVMRAVMLSTEKDKEVVTSFLRFKARDGHEIELKVYKSPSVRKGAALMVYFHGGGYVFGGFGLSNPECVYAAVSGNVVVVSVDYRLAPQAPFPTPFHDCFDALLWIRENHSLIGADPTKIIVAGSSAGGGLTAAVCLAARDQGITGIVGQVLNYPWICHPKFLPKDKYELGSHTQNADACTLTSSQLEFFANAHTPNAEPDWRHSPLLATSHANLPRTLINCAGFDPLRDEGFAYADALRSCGVDVVFHIYPGMPHIFGDFVTGAPQTVQFFENYAKFLDQMAQ